MSTINVVTYDNLHPDQFTKQGNKVTLLHTINVFEVTLQGQARIGETGGWDKRHFLQVSGAFGILHLDVISSQTATQTIATLPPTAPKPTRLIETQAFDGSRFWVNAGERTVNATIITANQRYVVNIVGFFSD